MTGASLVPVMVMVTVSVSFSGVPSSSVALYRVGQDQGFAGGQVSQTVTEPESKPQVRVMRCSRCRRGSPVGVSVRTSPAGSGIARVRRDTRSDPTCRQRPPSTAGGDHIGGVGVGDRQGAAGTVSAALVSVEIGAIGSIRDDWRVVGAGDGDGDCLGVVQRRAVIVGGAVPCRSGPGSRRWPGKSNGHGTASRNPRSE